MNSNSRSSGRELPARAAAVALSNRDDNTAGEAVAWCTHPRARHIHGTAAAYTKDGCHCGPCRVAHWRAAKRAELERFRGSPEWVADLQPLRAHLNMLRMWLTTVQIEQRSGQNRTMIRYILGEAPGRPPAHRVRRNVYEALMAVNADPVDQRDDGLVDATGSLRRFRALVAIGYPQTWLAKQLNISPQNVGTTFNGSPVRASLRQRLIDVYAQWSTRPPQGRTSAKKRAISAARTIAARNGWWPPAAWDDDTIDDPNAGHNPDGTLEYGLPLAS